MVTFDETTVVEYIKQYEAVPKFIQDARVNTSELKALIRGIDFKKYLIERIEILESKEKAEARKKYSREIKDFWVRLLRLVDNVYSATGGSKVYNFEGDDLKKMLKAVMNVRGGMSLEKWLATNWMPLYHNDPSGVIFLEYDSKNNKPPYPTYKSIHSIRWYESDGQKLKSIIFEPKKTEKGQVWRVVDDKTDWRILQIGNEFQIIEELTFEHIFGAVPGLINSDIIDTDTHQRLSPIDSVVAIAKEYARDLSVKTIYKFKKGIPLDWRFAQICRTCNGTGKINEDGIKSCGECDGYGHYKGKDVTDCVIIGLPKENQTIPSPIAGSISPDLDTLEWYVDELDRLKQEAYQTHWGIRPQQEVAATATEIILDHQPAIIRLDEYSGTAENMEKQLTEWIANYHFPTKKKDEEASAINYGKRFIIEPVDSILSKYQASKDKGDNAVILDRLFNEYLTAKHKSDLPALNEALKKSSVEPYLHSKISEIKEVFGEDEAKRKILFEEWWKTLTSSDKKQDEDSLKQRYNEWFDAQTTKEGEELEPDQKAIIDAQASLRGSVGGVTGIIGLLNSIAEGKATAESAVAVLIEIYGISEEVARRIVQQNGITNQNI